MSLLGLLTALWKHPANRKSRLAAIRRFVIWQLLKRVDDRPVTIDFHGLRLTVHPDSHSSSKALYFSGLPDYREMRFMLEYLRPGDRFVDVGANVGLYTLLAASIVGPRGHVEAFEPGEIPATRLEADVEANGLTNVTIHRLAASDHAFDAILERTGDDCTSRLAVTETEALGNRVAAARLDQTLPDVPYAMFKLDIEGHEPMAIRGAERLLLAGNPPVVQVEMAGYSEAYGVSTPELIERLDRLGYSCTVFDPESKRLTATDRPWEVPVDNVLAVHRDSMAFVEERVSVAAS